MDEDKKAVENSPLKKAFSCQLMQESGYSLDFLESETKYWVAFDRAEIAMSGTKLRLIYDRLGSLEKLWKADPLQIAELGQDPFARLPFLTDEVVGKIVSARSRIDPDALIQELKDKDVWALCLAHPNFPFGLREIHQPPAVLYIKGKPDFIRLNKSIAVVGTRNPSPYGQKVAKQFASELGKRGITVISGMALGIDSHSHWGAIEAGGTTVAVLGSGPDVIYPATNRRLHQKLIETPGCAVLSEYFPGTKPQTWMFPQRNRIISGLSQGVLVVEAGQKSGSLLTANQAFDQGRLVFAIPGRIDSPASDGTNHLISSNKAKLVSSIDDLLSEFAWITGQYDGKPVPVELFGPEKEVYDLICANPQIHFDQLAEKSSLSAGELSSALIMLELAGAVERLAGDNYQAS